MVKKQLTRLQNEAKTVVLIAVDGILEGMIGIADPVKDSSREAIAELSQNEIAHSHDYG